MPDSAETTAKDARFLVQALLDKGLTADQISRGLEERVSPRTIYRWKNGESSPQQPSDLDALRRFAKENDIDLPDTKVS